MKFIDKHFKFKRLRCEKNESRERGKVCVLTFARAWNTVVATRDLGLRGIKVITGDNTMVAAGNFSKYSQGFFTYPDPDSDPMGFLGKLREVCEKYNDGNTDVVLMPMHTDSFLIAEHKKLFEGIAATALPEKRQIDLIGDKANLAEFCLNNNIRVPATVVLDIDTDVESATADLNYPAFLKMAKSNAAIGLHKVESPSQAAELFQKDIEKYGITGRKVAVAQEAVPGEDYCSTFLFDNGRSITSMTYHNILDYPRKGGMGALRETVDAEPLEKAGRELLGLVKWHGVAEIDFRWDGKNAPYLIEVNPRFWGGLGQSVESGISYPYLLFELAVEGHLEPLKTPPKKIRTYNPCLLALIILEELFEIGDTDKKLDTILSELANELTKNKPRKFAPATYLRLFPKLAASLGQSITPAKRIEAVRKVLLENRGAVNELIRNDDPLPLLGLLYPLAVFLKNGKLSPDMLVTGTPKVKEKHPLLLNSFKERIETIIKNKIAPK